MEKEMKRKDLLLLTLLLTQTTPVWSMVDEDIKQTSTPHRSNGARQESKKKINLDKLRADIQKAQEDTQARLARYDNVPDKDNKVIVVGYSGNGKTTLIEGLAGNLYARDEDDQIKLASRSPLRDFKIGEGLGKAGTTLPGGWYDAQKSRKKVFWDCPGFGDPGVDGNDIINAAAIRELFTPNTQARILLVIDENVLFEAQPLSFQKLLNEVAGVFPNTDQLKTRTSMVVTKKMPGRNPQSRLKTLKDKGSLQQLTDPARELFTFLADNAQTRLAMLPAALEEGEYTFDKEAIFKVIENSQPTLNPIVKPYLNDSSKILTLDLARELNEKTTDFIKSKGAASIISYCKNEIAKDKNSIATLKTSLPAVVRDLRSLTKSATQGEILSILDRFLPNQHPLRKTFETLDFLKELNKDVTYDLPTWSQALTNKTTEVNKMISDLATHHNTGITNFLKTQGAQLVIDYCGNEINNHQGSVGDLRTNLKKVLKDLQDLQNPKALPTASTFSSVLQKYFNRSTLLKDTVDAFDYLGKNINGSISCDIKNWSAALKGTTDKLKKLTDNPEVRYDETSKVLSLKGTIIGTSDLTVQLRNHPNPVRIDILGLHTLFVDANIVSQGTLINFIAPQWTIVGSKSINVKGKDSPKAVNGTTPGSDGSPGIAGGNGGHFYGKGVSFTNLNQLTIVVTGGKGGEGGNGAKGTTGSAASNGSAAAMVQDSSVPHVELENHTYMNAVPVKGTKYTYKSGGGKGGKGGTGGKGGAGGKGGLSGVALIQGTQQSYTLIKNNGGTGIKGKSGAGGDGGRGGDLWRSTLISELNGSYGRVFQQGWGPTRHDVHVTEHVSKPQRWELTAQKVGDGPQGDTGDKPAETLVSSVRPSDPTPLCLDSKGNLTSDYKNARVKEYKDFQLLQSVDPLVSPFIKLFTNL